MCASSVLDVVLLQARRERLGNLRCLLLVGDLQCVQVGAHAQLELGGGSILLDLNELGVLFSRHLEKLTNIVDFLRHG